MSADAAIRRLPVPEIRDYHQINRRVAQWLDAGATRIRLEGVERQRLLLSGLRGAWSALVEVVGHAGPELAAGLDAPGLVIVAHGSVDDGAGRNLSGGALLIDGEAGAALGYRQSGGLIAVNGGAGPRAALEQSGGRLVVLGPVGILAGERQRGGSIAILTPEAPRLAGRGRVGGELNRPVLDFGLIRLACDELEAAGRLAGNAAPWLRGLLDEIRRT